MAVDNATVFTNTTRSRLALAQSQRDRNQDGVLVLRESSNGKTHSATSSRFSQLRRPASLPPPGGGRKRTAAPRKPKQMDTQPVEYWNSQAKNYDEKIFSTIDEDTTGVIMESIEKYSSLDEGSTWGRCLDLGCGAGKYLPALAKRFHSVTACDLSPKLADLARQETERKGFTNVTVHVRDLSEFWTLKGDPRSSRTQLLGDKAAMSSDIGCLDFQGYGFAVMANVLIAPVHDCVRTMMLKNAQRCLTPGGHLLAVVPSLESAMYVNMRCQEANYEGPYTTGKQALKHAATAGGPDIFKGILERVGVRTKHFLEAEFVLLANRAGFTIESCEKVSYQWKSELGLDKDEEVPPRLRQPPLPWDWLFVLRNGDVAG